MFAAQARKCLDEGSLDDLWASRSRQQLSEALEELDNRPTLLISALPDVVQLRLAGAVDCAPVLPQGVQLAIWRERALALTFHTVDQLFSGVLALCDATPGAETPAELMRVCIRAMDMLLDADDQADTLAKDFSSVMDA